MSLKLATALLVAVAVTSSPALACKGPTVIFADSFQTEDAAWGVVSGTFSVSGGQAQLTEPAGEFGLVDYGGAFIDSGDACVDIASPSVTDPTTVLAGIVFGFVDGGNFYLFLAREDGQAAVFRSQNGHWLTPVSFRPAPSLKTGGNVSNTLRITWSGTSASTFINDQPFINFNLPQALQNTRIGLYAENDADGPITYQFSNLNVTNVP